MANLSDLYDQAIRSHQNGNLRQAETLYRQILQLDPRQADALHLLGFLGFQTGHPQEGIPIIRRAITLNPQDPIYHFNLGIVLHSQGQLPEAAACFQAALRINPQGVEVYKNLAEVFRKQGKMEEAIACLSEALRINPEFVEGHNDVGILLKNLGRLTEALEHFDHALSIDPEHAPSRWNRALLRLRWGELLDAWKDYEFRWQKPGCVARHLDRPRWDGSLLAGRTILIYAEQGLGDTIHFIRFAPLVKERGGNILFECQPQLKKLLADVAGVDQLLVQGSAPPPFDVQVPLMSLPGLLRTTLATIPGAGSYLRANPKQILHWRKELAPLDGFKLGIVWQGTPTHANDPQRSVPLAQFAPLGRLEGVRLISLQVGKGKQQLEGVPFPITDLGSRFDLSTLDDLAAVLMSLHLVVTVDTAVAHLAGALGVPVWVVLPIAPDWRWFLDRSDSPWYPTMRLFRQRRPGDWADVFQQVAAEVSPLSVVKG